jgi:predicted RNA-binding protein with PUA-like domain
VPNLWLIKSDPDTYSLASLEADRKTVWDGVKNPLALKHLAQMKPGDRLLVYHTGDEKAVVGLASVRSAAYPDPKKQDPKLLVVDIDFVGSLPSPVTLAAIKASPKFQGFDLVRLPRLSVMPVSAAQWAEIERLARG